LLIANMFLFYRFVRTLSQREDLAWIAVFLSSYHAWFVDLYYSTGTVYDLLCVFAYMIGFNKYIDIRSSGQYLHARHWLVLLFCYAAALNSKEMAVTLPLFLGIYELLYHTPQSVRRIWKWLGQECRAPLALAVLTIPYAWSKVSYGNIAENPMYRPRISAKVFMYTYQIYLNPLFYMDHVIRSGSTILILFALLVVSVVSGRRFMIFSWCFLSLSVLPFIFIPHYATFFFYLPTFGWGMMAAGLLLMLRDGLAKMLTRAIKLKFLTQRNAKAIVLAFLIILLGSFLAVAHSRESEKALHQFMSVQVPISPLIKGLREVCPDVRSGTILWFKSDPFPRDAYTLEQTVRLSSGDRSATIIRGGKRPAGDVLALNYDGKKLWIDEGAQK